MTAATGESAPSNPRVGLRLTSCSYEQDSPDRKLFSEIDHALLDGNQSFEFKIEGATVPAKPLRRHPAQFLHRVATRAPTPQVDGQLAGQGDDGFLFHGRARGQFDFHFLGRLPARLPFEKAPQRLHQHGPDSPVAQTVNTTDPARVPAAVFARTTAGVTAHLLAIVKALPVTHL